MWFITKDVFSDMQAAVKAANFSASDVLNFEARERGETPLTVAGDKAEILVEGVLTERPSFFAFMTGRGQTSYPDIIAALAEAEADDSVSEIILRVNSPGGSVAGMFKAMDAVAATTKPTRAVVDMAASAAYGIASQADSIEAASDASQVGSIGIAFTGYMDADEVTITSSNAPDKRPDLSTEEGQAVVRAQLDEFENLFTSRIAAGRGVDQATVNADYGRGAVMLADSALRQGLIDSVQTNTASTSGGATKQEASTMDIATLKATHPDVYAAVVQVGQTQERDRVVAHLTYGESSGALDVAVAAVKGGDEITHAVVAQYMTASRNQADTSDRQADDADAAAADDAADDVDKDAQATAHEQSILDATAAACGVTLEGSDNG